MHDSLWCSRVSNVSLRMPLVHDTSMPSGLNLSATGLSVAATKGVGTTMSTTSQLVTTEDRSPVAVKLPGHLWPVCVHGGGAGGEGGRRWRGLWGMWRECKGDSIEARCWGGGCWQGQV
jgi:hypothetical protein